MEHKMDIGRILKIPYLHFKIHAKNAENACSIWKFMQKKDKNEKKKAHFVLDFHLFVFSASKFMPKIFFKHDMQKKVGNNISKKKHKKRHRGVIIIKYSHII